ncbi:MAG: NACHT domain-containing protein [Stenomitos frigidus ULC029]
MADDNRVNISGGNVQGLIQENHGTVTQNFIYQVSELISGQTSVTEQPLTQGEYRQRQVLLSKVKEYWIEGVLEKSLHTKSMIELGLESRLDAVARPFSDLEESSEESRQILPTGISATDVFNQIGEGRTLLILGEPGAGKTITLLKLAQDLVARAEDNVRCLLPIVVNLSSWGSKQQTIADWLGQELWLKYQVPKKVGKDWVENQQLLLLLDGLDEVKANRREACIEAINEFTQKYGQTEMVVCSRIADYQVLSNRLQLRGAIYIRNLTPDQVNQYLDTAGEQLEGVKTLLQEDAALQELTKSPLMLNILTLAYHGKKAEDLGQTGSLEVRRQHLFNAYIERMFRRKQVDQQYPKAQTIQWLTWLAQRMSQTSQSMFLIEQIQPTWLQTQSQRKTYCFGAFLISVLIASLMGLINVPNIGWNYALLTALFGGLSIGTAYVLAILHTGEEIKITEKLEWSWDNVSKSLQKGFLIGLGLGLIIGMATSFAEFSNHIVMYKDAMERVLKFEVDVLSLGLIYGLCTALLIGLIYGLTGDLKSFNISTKSIRPNQGVWRSAINALKIGTIDWLIFVIFFFLLGLQLQRHPLILALRYSLGYGLIGGLLFGLASSSGRVCIQHFTLRLIMHSNNYAPWNYAHFLDYASKRIFLQKVGGGYIFVHRMLLEHFAQMK